jgi:5'-3' exonuclease
MKPVFVFDGGRTPQKDATNEDRQARRAIRCDAYENGVEGAEAVLLFFFSAAQDPRPKIRDPKFLSRAERREPQ